MALNIFYKEPKITGSREYVFKGNQTTETYEGEVPQEMSEFSKTVVGDGQARVAVSADMSEKDYGNGVNVSVTLSLSCNQDDQTINTVVQTLGMWSREYCKQQLAIARAEYLKMKS